MMCRNKVSGIIKWVPRDSNPGPTGYEPAALTAELGTHRAGDGIRTRDILLGRQALYR